MFVSKVWELRKFYEESHFKDGKYSDVENKLELYGAVDLTDTSVTVTLVQNNSKYSCYSRMIVCSLHKLVFLGIKGKALGYLSSWLI